VSSNIARGKWLESHSENAIGAIAGTVFALGLLARTSRVHESEEAR
jgi:hypothetical protein